MWTGWRTGWAPRRMYGVPRRWKATCRNARCAGCRLWPWIGRGRLASGSAAAGAPARSAAAGGRDGAAAGPAAGGVHLAPGAPPGAPGRRAGTYRRRMVEAGGEMRSVRDYFRVEDEEGRSLLAVPPGRWRGRDHRRYALVPARVFLRGSEFAGSFGWKRSSKVWRLRCANEGRKRVNHADETMARITADRLVRHLAESGFVLRRPGGNAASDVGHGG